MLAAFWGQTFFIPKPKFTERDMPDQTGKVHIITGGYTGIGLEVAKLLYPLNATIYLAGRSPSKGTTAIAALRTQFPNSRGRLEFLHLDLADLPTIKASAAEFLAKETRLDVLLNNAGIMIPPEGSKSPQGFEAQTATNIYGPFLFTQLLYPLLKKTAAGAETGSVRVSWAASLAADLVTPKGGVVFTGSGANEEVKGDIRGQIAYGQSKAANVMLGVEAARRWGKDGIISNSFNPGNLRSELQRSTTAFERLLIRPISYHVSFGGYTELYAAFSPDITPAKNGAYILPWGRIGKYNTALQNAIKPVEEGGEGRAKKLWEVCEKVVAKYM
ncbi:NAD(P)-binding protein [Melanomma pulvis-pyrius CBS 109.77]|uniref:NAD(P)-binding protein n=1 Tax=Melanomma pulvis-pyrius CBS 109.77 TaxID=1314802 RepID=A0A6A6XWI2_9PLEO|nr:NAD(P)-binding protein [Melanomma pulvis-pyrius CBS 109.77]